MSAANYRLVRGLLLAFLGLWLLLTLFPFYWQIITALKDAAETNRTVPTFWPEVWHPGNFKLVFAEASNFQALVDSFVIATGNTLASLVLGTWLYSVVP